MANPIKETPILKGTDACRFRKAIELSEKEKISKEELERVRKNFEFFQSKSNF